MQDLICAIFSYYLGHYLSGGTITQNIVVTHYRLCNTSELAGLEATVAIIKEILTESVELQCGQRNKKTAG